MIYHSSFFTPLRYNVQRVLIPSGVISKSCNPHYRRRLFATTTSLREQLEAKRAQRTIVEKGPTVTAQEEIIDGRTVYQGTDTRKAELAEWRKDTEDQVYERAEELQLFAYATNRDIPWVTLSFMGISLITSAYFRWFWNSTQSARTKEDIEREVDNFLSQMEFAKNNILLSSFVRIEATPMSVLYGGAFFFASALLERMYGPARLAGLIGISTITGNAASSLVEANVSSSPAVLAVSTVALIKFRNWAIWPGIPIPQWWLFVPLLISQVTLARRFWESKEIEEDKSLTKQLHLVSAMDLAAENAFENMEQPPNFGIVNDEFEIQPTRDTTILSHVTGAILGGLAAFIF